MTTLSDDLDVYAMVVDNATNINKSDNGISNVESKMTMAYEDENQCPALGRHINATLLNGLIKYCPCVVHCYIQLRRYGEAASNIYLITG